VVRELARLITCTDTLGVTWQASAAIREVLYFPRMTSWMTMPELAAVAGWGMTSVIIIMVGITKAR
jgi:hypothetical protein